MHLDVTLSQEDADLRIKLHFDVPLAIAIEADAQ